MNEPIISVSGLRGVVGDSLTPLVALRFAAAYHASLPESGAIVIARDGRVTGPILVDAIRATLGALGRDVLDAGVTATPTVGVLVRARRAAGAIQVTASHNPPQYNGLKLFNSAGRIIPAAAGAQVLERYRAAAEPAWVDYRRVGRATPIDDPDLDHLGLVLATVDVARIRDRAFHVVLDSNHGAGGRCGRKLLELLGCKVTHLGAEPTGLFAHPPEPTLANLTEVARRVGQLRADVGFCQDPDADRLAIIDERGEYVGEEYSPALCVDHVLRTCPGPVVTNCSSSRMTADLAARYGVPYFASAVGEANVVDRMLAVGATFGGEGSGGPIDPRVGYIRDSFVGMALVLDALAARQATVSGLVRELPRYVMQKSTIDLPRERVTAAFDAVERAFSDARPDRLDGLRLDWSDRWVLVRGSNTEPIVRVIAEAPTEAAAAQLVDEVSAVLRGSSL